jgi:HD-GYP domain-containing protein (c-di-GMP phosphodiesterase class II)
MMSQRPYRNAMALDAAIDELRRCSGSQFDAGIVETLVKIVTEGRAAGGRPVPTALRSTAA